ncbi:hypothetical protein Tco_0673635 [Tanacetum coccineum]
MVRNPWSSLIPLSRGSFDVIVEMDWLSKRKFVIVCHEKVVRIPLEGDEILRVHGERTQGVVKTLMNTKSKEEHEVHLKLVLESLRKEKLYDKVSKFGDALSRKERVKSRRVRGMILAAQSEVLLVGNVMDGARTSRYLVHPGADKTSYNLEDMYCLRYLSENEIESPWILSLNFQGQSNNSKEWNSGDDQIEMDDLPRGFGRRCRKAFGVLHLKLCMEGNVGRFGESSLTRLELVQETTDKVVLVKEKPKVARDRQKIYVDYRRKPLEFEVGDRILERIGLVAYRLRLPEELNNVHDTFHVSNLKKCLAYANLHVPLDEIKVDKTLRFVEEPVEIMYREIKRLKRRKVALVKVRWNSKRGPEFTWEHED